jgi:23S rRNA G2069 N7-methylase RlmK/C1962 C5-methylase RlmI
MRNWAFGEKDKNYPMKFLGPLDTGPEVSLFWTSIKNHFVETLKYKKSLNPNDTCFRWIFSENDLFPGLIVDIFGHTAIAQIQTPFVEDFWDKIFLVLCESLKECHFNLSKFQWSILRNHQFRNDEGLELIENENLSLEESVETWMGLKWKMSPGRGQKTGAFLDQGDNHLRAVHWSKQLSLKTCWDLFCFEGGFGVYAAWDPYAEFYMLTHPLYYNKDIEVFYGRNANKRIRKRMKELGIPFYTHKAWVEPEDMWLYSD